MSGDEEGVVQSCGDIRCRPQVCRFPLTSESICEISCHRTIPGPVFDGGVEKYLTSHFGVIEGRANSE